MMYTSVIPELVDRDVFDEFITDISESIHSGLLAEGSQNAELEKKDEVKVMKTESHGGIKIMSD